jgi:inositol-phosphate phosphatase/L-galactose 1-phosphate phosphatase/histidinol-phosphatase
VAFFSDFGLRELTSVHEALAFAEDLADAARLIAKRHARSPLQIVAKYDGSPVTIVDCSIEQVLRELIAERYPDHAVIGAQRSAEPRNATWVLDPIESTKRALTGSDLFGTSIALVENTRPVLGVIDLPVLRERWTGTPGATHFNGRPVWTSAQKSLTGAQLYMTSRGMFSPEGLAVVEGLARQASLRRFGGDCCAYGLLASGHCDLVVEEGLRAKDFMALVCVVEGAGGIVTDWTGAPLDLRSDGRVVAAATRQLHAEAIEILRRAAPASRPRA